MSSCKMTLNFAQLFENILKRWLELASCIEIKTRELFFHGE